MTQPVFYKDLVAGHRTYTEEDLGRKGLSLAQLVANNVPVPPFFILRADLFKSIISTIFQDTTITSLEEFRKKVLAVPFSPQTIAQIESEYQKISGFGKAWVAVRSSIVAPLHKELSFSGLFHTYLNVRGTNDIETAIKDVYNSLFHDRAYDYIKKNKVSYGDISSAIIVQKMIQAEVSGVMYTYDPITLDKGHVSIEAVFGLGDVLADGSVNPDIYTVSKSTLEIVEKKIVPQDWMKVRKVGDTETLEHLQKISISKIWQYSQKLDDNLIRELAQLADNVEHALGGPQVIEWAMERGSLYVLQAKSIEPKYTVSSNPINEPTHKVSTIEDIDSFTKIAENTQVSVLSAEQQPAAPVELPSEILLFSGTAASSGTAYGEAFVIPSTTNLTEENIQEMKSLVSKKHIIVTDEFSGTVEPLFMQAGGIITNYGGVNSDAALTARELKIPAVVGTRIATSFIQAGALLKIDGSSGAVYRVEFIPEQKVEANPTAFTSSEVNVLKAISSESKKVTTKNVVEKSVLAKRPDDSATKVFLTDSIHGNYAYLPQAKAPLSKESLAGIMIPIQKADKNEALRIKRVKRKTTADIYLVLSDIPSIEELLKTKRILAARGIRRTKSVKVLVSIGSIYGLLNSKNLAGMSVDGFVYDVKALSASYLPGTEKIDDQLWKLLADNLESLHNEKLSFIGLSLPQEYFTVPLRKELHPLLKMGVNALVFAEYLPHALEQDVTDIEKEMISLQLG